jgi:pimeloyl-ACP methyl ester carboxylesterase
MPVTDTRLASGRPGFNLLLRNKICANAGLPVLCMHGVTCPGSVTFDYLVEGCSGLDVLAASGRNAWCLDLLGYGGSDCSGGRCPVRHTSHLRRAGPDILSPKNETL